MAVLNITGEVTKAGEGGTCLWLNMGLPLGLQKSLGYSYGHQASPVSSCVQLGYVCSTVRPGEDIMDEQFLLISDARPFPSVEGFLMNSNVTNHRSSKDADRTEQSDHFNSRSRNLSMCLLCPSGYLVKGQL